MENEINRQFNNLYSELEILNNNLLEINNSLELLQKKNLCISLLDKNKKKKISKKKIKKKNNSEAKNEINKNEINKNNIDSDLELELILSRTPKNKNPKKKTKKKKKIVRSVMVLDTSSDSEN